MKKFYLVLTLLVLTLVYIVGCGSSATNAPAPTLAPISTTRVPSQPTIAAPSNIITATPESNNDSLPTANPGAFTKINLNTATAQEILTIPNTGNRMVREFQEYRPYTSITQFRREIGKYVDAATVAEYENYVYVPVNVNQADAETLQQIPGITAEIAAQLIAARPYGSNQNFLAKLATFTDAPTITLAQNYLAQ